MNRSELEHAIRAACDVAGDDELIVAGSQAILGGFPDAPSELRVSREVDVYPKNRPEAAETIDGVLGELSRFDRTHGFYIHGIGPETARLPDGWRERLVPVRNENTRFCTGWCLEVHDLAASKLVAGREKDVGFVAALLRHRMVDPEVLRERIAALELRPEAYETVEGHLERIVRQVGRRPK